MAKQSKEELEKWYEQEDPWGVKASREDMIRIGRIQSLLSNYRFGRALDIGAGEGVLSAGLPASEIDAIEISDKAASRLPSNVRRVYQPDGEYGLVVSCGTLYPQYDWRQVLDWLKKAREVKGGVVLVAGIKEWLVPEISELGEPTFIGTFPYKEYKQEVRIYE